MWYVVVKSILVCQDPGSRYFYCVLLSLGPELWGVYLCCSVNGSVCLVGCVFNSVCELFGEIIRNIFLCGCYFVVECYGGVECGWRCSVG